MKTYPDELAKVRLAVDVVVFTYDEDKLKVLLIRRQQAPYAGRPALPGGFLWAAETTAEAAARILHDKAGVTGVFTEQLFTFDAPKRDPRGRVVSVTYYALVPSAELRLEPGIASQAPALHAVDDSGKLAFDHSSIVDYAAERLRSKLAYTNAAYSLLPERFTFSQLQQLYEVVLDRSLDKRNFRKKYLSLGLIEPTKEQLSGGRHRPAQLYRFVTRRPIELPAPAF